MYSDLTMNRFLDWLANLAEEKRNFAALSGDKHDGGYTQIINQIEVYKSARKNKFPLVWKRYKDQFEIETDPEYKMYLELKKKFDE